MNPELPEALHAAINYLRAGLPRAARPYAASLGVLALLGVGLLAACIGGSARPSQAAVRAPSPTSPALVASALTSQPRLASVTPDAAPPTPTPTATPWPTSTPLPPATATAPRTATATAPRTATLAPTQPITQAVDTPPRLVIPKLSLDQEIVTVPIVKGEWKLDDLGDQIGRLETTGRMPGDALAITIAGHVTTSAVHAGPFAELWRLRLGDAVIFRTGETDYVYQVYAKLSALPQATGLLYAQDGQRLMLITCGEWDYLNFDYARRLIVEAKLTDQYPTP